MSTYYIVGRYCLKDQRTFTTFDVMISTSYSVETGFYYSYKYYHPRVGLSRKKIFSLLFLFYPAGTET
jgi:hypothetical protein